MPTKLLIGLLIIPAILLGLLLSADYVVVDVRAGGPQGHHLIIPVPLFLAQVAVRFAPSEAQYIAVPEIAPYLPAIEQAVDELRGARDGVLVSVEEGEEKVLVAKAGENIKVDVVEGEDEEVHVTVPLDAAKDILSHYDGEGFRTRELVKVIRSLSGDLVHLRDGDEEVKIWIW
ncbi:MAG: hypothetical protein ACE5HV_10660 [Acidobacteriota bacterium]